MEKSNKQLKNNSSKAFEKSLLNCMGGMDIMDSWVIRSKFRIGCGSDKGFEK